MQFNHDVPFQLESGEIIPRLQLEYQSWGTLNKAKDNVIWVCHALTGNADVPDWWPDMVGPGLPFDTNRFFVICANMPGSCYGSTGPLSLHPESDKPWFHAFPALTTLDMAKAFDLLRQYLDIQRIELVSGGSMGGQVLLSWAVWKPFLFNKIAPLATNAFHSPWGIAFNEAQRMAIETDPSWKLKNPYAGKVGMRAARATAMLSYRHYRGFFEKQFDPDFEKTDDYLASSYLQHMGDKIAARFNAFSYWTLSKAMDAHQLGRGFGGTEAALKRIASQALVISIESDMLFPVEEQEYLARHIPDARLEVVSSPYGHDGFFGGNRKNRKAVGGLFMIMSK